MEIEFNQDEWNRVDDIATQLSDLSEKLNGIAKIGSIDLKEAQDVVDKLSELKHEVKQAFIAPRIRVEAENLNKFFNSQSARKD